MIPTEIEAYNQAKTKELYDRVSEELKCHDGKNLLERYALFMIRVQMYEIYLKNDLHELFEVEQDKADRMNLNSIFRFFVKNDIRAHPILYSNLQSIANDRNRMAHEFLAVTGMLSAITDGLAGNLIRKDLERSVWELELAFQQYSMLKEEDQLYKDYGVKPEYED